MNTANYPTFTANSFSGRLDRYRRCIFEQVDLLNPDLPIPQDQILNMQTTVFVLLDAMANEIADLGEELGEIE